MTKEFTGNGSNLETVVAQQTAPTRLLRNPAYGKAKVIYAIDLLLDNEFYLG